MVDVLDQIGIVGFDSLHGLPRAAAQLEHDVLLSYVERTPRGAMKLPILELGKFESRAHRASLTGLLPP